MRHLLKYLPAALLMLLCMTTESPLCGADQSAPIRSFRSGEELRYAVSYKVGLINTDVAEVCLTLTEANSSGKEAPTQKSTQESTSNPTQEPIQSPSQNPPQAFSSDTDGVGDALYRITASAKTLSLYKWFFDMSDCYELSLDAQTLRPQELRAQIKEGDYRFSSRLSYDWERMEAHSAYRNHKNPDTTYKTLPLRVGQYDALSHFYNLRCRYIGSFEKGRAEYIDVVLEDTVRTISFRYLGREQLRIKGLGRCSTLCFECELVTSNGESFEDGSRFKVWFSDDRNYIPLYGESPIRVGSIRVRLTHSSGLKYTPSYRID